MINTVRVQEKGQVTIPRTIRQQLNLKKGDLVTFISTQNGVMIKTLDLAAEDLLTSLGTSLQLRGIAIENVMTRSEEIDGKQLAREYHLLPEEQDALYQALQLKAQAAVEKIRFEAESNNSTELTEDEIEAEIQEARKESRNAGSH